MSLESYVRHITQKYRLVLALAVLKEKPEELSVEEYIKVLKNNLNKQNDEDLDMSVCSDDFAISNYENSVTETDNGISTEIHTINNTEFKQNDANNTNLITDINKSITVNTDEMLTDTQSILEDKFDKTPSSSDSRKAIESNNETEPKNKYDKKNHTQINALSLMISKSDNTHISNDNVKTVQINNNIRLIQAIEKENFINVSINNVKESNSLQSYNNNTKKETKITRKPNERTNLKIATQTIDSKSKNIENHTFNRAATSKETLDTVPSETSIQNNNIHISDTQTSESTLNNVQIFEKNSQNNNIIEDYSQNSETLLKYWNNDGLINDIDERLYINTENSCVKNHIDQNSQTNPHRSIEKQNIDESTYYISQNEEYAQNNEEIDIFFNDITKNTHLDIAQTDINTKNDAVDTQNLTHVSQSQYENVITVNEKLLKRNKESVKISNTNTDNTTVENIKEKQFLEIPQVKYQELMDVDAEDISQNTLNKEYTELEEYDMNTESREELVPFKVIEELNKVKTYLNRADRIINSGSFDSGYRSDSQSRGCLKSSLQLSGSWVNQSAHCLFEYLIQCTTISTTQEVTNEISQVLGQLINKLHEEEKYLTFLDDILENGDCLLKDIAGCGNTNENVLLNKDEKINRLFLINKSIHIQKYTIEKITNILEDMYKNLSAQEEIYEITNIDETENICYIFHILEHILLRYIKNKDVLSQSTISQGELKKSSITDIWRKKWNPKYKENMNTEVMTPKKCVLLKCNEILNKFIVNCMDGYSLISFAALQCFNLLQT